MTISLIELILINTLIILCIIQLPLYLYSIINKKDKTYKTYKTDKLVDNYFKWLCKSTKELYKTIDEQNEFMSELIERTERYKNNFDKISNELNYWKTIYSKNEDKQKSKKNIK